jgi:large subunit ribosomal protein L17
MRKRVAGKKLSRGSSTRKALMRSLTRALIINGKIETTYAKAKFAQKFVEKLVSSAKEDSVSARRRVLAAIANDREILNALFKSIAKSNRSSGFTRIVPLKSRRGDLAKMARLELIDWVQILPETKKENTPDDKKKSTNQQSKSKSKKATKITKGKTV